MEVFNAIEHMVGTPSEKADHAPATTESAKSDHILAAQTRLQQPSPPPAKPAPKTEPVPEDKTPKPELAKADTVKTKQPDSIEFESGDEFIIEEDDLVFQDNPDEDANETGYRGMSAGDDELSDDFRDLDNLAHQPFDNTSVADDKPTDESWAERMLQEIDDDLNDFDDNHPIDKPTPQRQATTKPTTKPAMEPVSRQEPHIGEVTDDFNEPEEQRQALIQDHPFELHSLKSDPISLQSGSNLGWLGRITLTLFNIVLIAVLAAQVAWYHYDRLSQIPETRQWYELACEHLGCTLPQLVDTRKIISQKLIARSHPTSRKALIIDAVILNQASFEQPFPDIALYFSDLNNRVIAQRAFSPGQYLEGDLKQLQLMPRNTPIHITLEIIDPGNEAVNYTLRFFPSERDTAVEPGEVDLTSP